MVGRSGSLPAVSVVIPTYNDSHCLELTLRSLARQTLRREVFEVVVVRDGPAAGDDPVDEAARTLDVRAATLAERRGRSAARNAGVAQANGRTIVLLDSDCYAAPDLLARHHAFHETGSIARVLLGQRLEIDLPHLGYLMRGDPIPSALFTSAEARDPRFIGVDEAGIPDCLRTPWLFAHSNNVSMPAEVLAAVGGFNEAFGTRWGWEDLEFFYRVYQHLGAGAESFAYDPGVVCHHLPKYRDVMTDYVDFFTNEATVKQLYPHLDWEFHGLRLPTTVASKVRYYRTAIQDCLETGTCRLAPAWGWLERRLVDHDMHNMLWIGTGRDDVPLRDETMTFDYRSPVSARNLHLIGTAIPAPDGAFDAVVNVDFWRRLQWGDLCDFVREATRVAPFVLLVGTPTDDAPHRTVGVTAELAYVCRALAAHFDLAVDDDGEVISVTIRRS